MARGRGRGVIGRAARARLSLVGVPILLAAAIFGGLQESDASDRGVRLAALYPQDNRHVMGAFDYARFAGAGVLYCRDEDNVPRPSAASWLIGNRSLVMMNAHNFLDRNAATMRGIEDCFFQIGGKNYEFDAKTLTLGVPRDASHLHITDDWALVRLREPADTAPQPIPATSQLATGATLVKVTMVSPAGHGNFRGPSSIESCEIKQIDPPSEDDIRRVRHDCNDGYGGSGSGLFDEAGHLVAMQSASLDMNRREPFDIEGHYGSALMIEGKLRRSLLEAAATAGR